MRFFIGVPLVMQLARRLPMIGGKELIELSGGRLKISCDFAGRTIKLSAAQTGEARLYRALGAQLHTERDVWNVQFGYRRVRISPQGIP
jgi:hypothetical protein